MSIVNDIYNQLGGNKFLVCSGCKNIYKKGETILGMTIPRNASKANRLEIIYDEGLDLYNMRFFKHTNGRFSQKRYIETGDGWINAKDTEVKTFNGVYCDMLRELFEEVTGMYIPMSITINGYNFM